MSVDPAIGAGRATWWKLDAQLREQRCLRVSYRIGRELSFWLWAVMD